MKQLLSVLALAMVLVSCEKKMPEVVAVESNIALSRAYDSLHLVPNGFYHVAINRRGVIDSSICIRFVNKTSFTEYKTYTDTNGLHLLDSAAITAGSSYSEYQFPNPSDYNTAVGYVKTKYFPIGGTLTGFSFHDYFVADTLVLAIGAPTKYNKPYALFLGVAADSPDIKVAIYQ